MRPKNRINKVDESSRGPSTPEPPPVVSPRGGVNYCKGELKVDVMLKPEHRDTYERMVGDSRSTRVRLLKWLREQGYAVGFYAVDKHRHNFRGRQQVLRDAGRLARMIVDEAREFGDGALAEATLVRAEQLLMQQMVRMSDEANLEAKDWGEWQKVIGAVVTNRREMQDAALKFEEAKRGAAAEARKLADGGADARTVAQKVCDLLGVKDDDDDDDPGSSGPETLSDPPLPGT